MLNNLAYAYYQPGNFTIVQFFEYRLMLIKIEFESIKLTNYIYQKILYWQQQEKLEPQIDERPFLNRG